MLKKLLIIDHWYGVRGGANKSTLYQELSKFFDLHFLKCDLPAWFKVSIYAKTFDFNVSRWKRKKARFEETVEKRPEIFKLMTGEYTKRARGLKGKFDAVLQIGSLFGPIELGYDVPHFSYSDSTVRNPELMWPDWMPEGFSDYRDEWYALEGNYFKSMRQIMVYSQFVKETLVNEYKVAVEKITVVGSALKRPEVGEIDWAGRKNNVIFVCTDFARKGGYKLIDIFDRVTDAVKDATLTVAGRIPVDFESNNKPWLNGKGALDRQALIEEYKRASIMILPADYDAFPSVILEAANFEIPSVASKVCGIPEMVSQGTTGLLVDPNDIQGFADNVIELLQDRGRLTDMGKAARRFVHEKFHPKVVANNIYQVIAKSLN